MNPIISIIDINGDITLLAFKKYFAARFVMNICKDDNINIKKIGRENEKS